MIYFRNCGTLTVKLPSCEIKVTKNNKMSPVTKYAKEEECVFTGNLSTFAGLGCASRALLFVL